MKVNRNLIFLMFNLMLVFFNRFGLLFGIGEEVFREIEVKGFYLFSY